MAEFATVEESTAPKPQSGRPHVLLARMQQYDSYVNGVGKGKVGKLVPDKNETARGVALRVSRAGQRANKSVTTWVVDDVVYFNVEQPEPAAKPKRATKQLSIGSAPENETDEEAS